MERFTQENVAMVEQAREADAGLGGQGARLPNWWGGSGWGGRRREGPPRPRNANSAHAGGEARALRFKDAGAGGGRTLSARVFRLGANQTFNGGTGVISRGLFQALGPTPTTASTMCAR
jgi:hypothetical protein